MKLQLIDFFNIIVIVIIIIIIIFFSQGKDYNWLEHIGWLEEKMKRHGQNWKNQENLTSSHDKDHVCRGS